MLRIFLTSLIYFGVLINCSASNDAIEELEKNIAAHKGQVIYVDFWASWCKPCRKAFPWMNKTLAEHKAKGFKIISVNLDNDKKYALEFLAETPASFDIIYDPKGKSARKLKVRGMPSSFLINRQGEIVSSHVGFNDDKKVKLEQEIIHLLSEK